MILTYGTLYGYMRGIGVKNPEYNAIIPTIGFNLSTWSVPYLKILWIRINYSQVTSNECAVTNDQTRITVEESV